MPNLINNPNNITDVGANYRKSFAPFSLFGTRQLKFYRVYISGLNVNHPDHGGDYFNANPYENPFGGPDGWDASVSQQRQPNYASDSAFARAIAGIQTQAEIYGVWHPDSNGSNPDSNSYFIVMVAGDTHADVNDVQYQYGNNSQYMQDAVYEALGGAGSGVNYVQVRPVYIAGDYIDWDSSNSLAPQAASPEVQAARDAVKAAQKALRDLTSGK